MRKAKLIEFFGAEVARVTLEDGTSFGVNAWEVVGMARRCDGFTNWKFTV